MTDADRQSYEDIIRKLMAKVEEQATEIARLRSDKGDAMSFLTEVINDPNATPAHRLKAAGLVLPHQVPALKPVEQPLELSAEPVEDLASVVVRQRARLDRLLALPLEERSALIPGIGGGDDSSSD